MEQQYARMLLVVQLEAASALFRQRQKAVERELGAVLDTLEGLPEDDDTGVVAAALAAAGARVDTLARRLTAWEAGEKAAVGALATRLAMLRAPSPPLWQLEVAVVEHLLRAGALAAAATVTAALPLEQRSLIDAGPLLEVYAAAGALSRGNLAPALAWVAAHASRLRRTRSQLEFALRKQEFVELVRRRESAAALEHATRHLAPAARAAASAASAAAAGGDGGGATGGRRCHPTPCAPSATPAALARTGDTLTQLQQAMSLLAFPSPTTCGVPAVERLFHDTAWPALARTFREDALVATGTPRHSVLEVAAAVGATALRTPSCRPHPASGVVIGRAGEACGCPLCHPHYFAAALRRIPLTARSVSRLVDPITHEPMDDTNPPLALPNGRVYGTKTVELLSSEDRSRVLCPHTGAVYLADDLRRVYVM